MIPIVIFSILFNIPKFEQSTRGLISFFQDNENPNVFPVKQRTSLVRANVSVKQMDGLQKLYGGTKAKKK